MLFGLAVVSSVACAGAAPAPSGQPAADQGPVPGGQLNMLVMNDPIDWDPNFGGRANPGEDGMAVAYNSVLSFKYGPDIQYTDMQLAPALAERWEVSPDAKTFTFFMRKGVKFAGAPPVNGREMSAADVKWSIEYYTRSGDLKDKKLPQGRNEFMFEGLDKVTTPDTSTAQVSFKESFVPFINYMASGRAPIVAHEIFDQDGHLKDKLIGTGPFQLDLAASQKGTRWVFKRNPTYWDEGKPYMDEVRWLVINSGATAQAAFQTKQLDRIDAVEKQALVEATKASPDLKSFKYIEPQVDKLRLSWVASQPTSDLRVRKAISMALDRDEINKVYAGGEGSWGLGGMFIGLFTEAEVKAVYKQDVNEAKKLLAEAGYPNGVSMTLPTDDARTQEVLSLFALIQAQLKRAGINLDIQMLDRNLQREKRRAGDFGIDGSTGAGSADADQDSTLYAEFHSSLASSTNNSKVKDAELDRLLTQQRREPDPAKRREILRAAVMRIAETMATVGMVHTPHWDIVQPYVQNYHPHFSVRAPYNVSWIRK